MVLDPNQAGQISIQCTQCQAKYWLARRSLSADSRVYRCKACGTDIDLTPALELNEKEVGGAVASGAHPFGPLISQHRYARSHSVSQMLGGGALLVLAAFILYNWVAEGKLSSPAQMILLLIPALIAAAGVWLLVDAIRDQRLTIELREGGLSVVRRSTSHQPWSRIVVQRSIARSGRQYIRLTFSGGSSLRFGTSMRGFDQLSAALKRKTGR